eukprot:gene7857-biopygen3082
MTGASQDLRALQGDGRYARVRATGLKPGDMFRPVDQALRGTGENKTVPWMSRVDVPCDVPCGCPVRLSRVEKTCSPFFETPLSGLGEPSKFTKRTLVHLGGYSFSGHAESVVHCPFQNPGPAGPSPAQGDPIEAARIGMLTNGTDGTYAWEIYNLHTVCMPSVATQTVQ